MLRYQATALALKCFGQSVITRRLYDGLGASVGRRSRPRKVEGNMRKAEWIRQQWLANRDPAQSSFTGLEVGTGWVHFAGLYLRLFDDIDLILYDVRDGRHFGPLQATFREIRERVDPGSGARSEVFDAIETSTSLEQLYARLGARYVLSSAGTLGEAPDESFDVVFSSDVLEHVHASVLPAAIASFHRVLKPGGLSIHQIGVDDHLSHYDPSTSKKQYLAYSDRTWARRFANDLQYINRVSFDEFCDLFRRAHFEEIEASTTEEPAEIEKIDIDEQYVGQSRRSIEATRVLLVHRRPVSLGRGHASKSTGDPE